MTRKGNRQLDAGDPFPRIDLRLIDGREFSLPDDLEEGYAVFLLYRGHW